MRLKKTYKVKDYLSILISFFALTISILAIVLQFFWKSHDLTANVLNVIGPYDSGQLSADIVIVNRGNQDEVVTTAYFTFVDVVTNSAVFSEEHIGPLIIKKGEAIAIKLSANMKRKLIFQTIRNINSKLSKDSTVTLGKALRKDAGLTFRPILKKDLNNLSHKSDGQLRIQQEVNFEVLDPSGGIVNIVYPCCELTVELDHVEVTLNNIYLSNIFMDLLRNSHIINPTLPTVNKLMKSVSLKESR